MSEETVDMLAGLHAVVAVLEAIRVDLGELYRRHEIGPTEHVRLDSLGWAVDRLGDDLHDVNVELRNLRLQVASARREAEDAREVRDAARELHLVECRKYNAEVVRRLALEKQVAELTKKLGELPAEPAPEPYQWQVGDEIEDSGGVRRPVTDRDAKGWVFIRGNGGLPQFEWEQRGWKLHRRALPRLRPRHVPLDEDLPEVPPFTPQQVAEFAEATEPIDDDEEQEEEIVTLAEWALVTSEPECSEWLPGRWDGESDGIGQVTMFRTGSTTERYVYNARIPVRDLRAAGINLGQWLRFREVLVCGESGKQEYRFEIRQCDQPISDSTGADGEGQS